jgi:hypothetical protein
MICTITEACKLLQSIPQIRLEWIDITTEVGLDGVVSLKRNLEAIGEIYILVMKHFKVMFGEDWAELFGTALYINFCSKEKGELLMPLALTSSWQQHDALMHLWQK